MWFEHAAELGWTMATSRGRRRARRVLSWIVLVISLASTYRIGSVDRLVERGFGWYVDEKAKEFSDLFREILGRTLPATTPSGEPAPTN